MAINLFANRPHAVVAKQTAFFVDLGLDTSNMHIIYLVDGYLYSWKPERGINAINQFVQGKGYYLVPKVDLDLEDYLAAPLPPVDIYSGVYD